jgi:hypothetical protein
VVLVDFDDVAAQIRRGYAEDEQIPILSMLSIF